MSSAELIQIKIADQHLGHAAVSISQAIRTLRDAGKEIATLTKKERQELCYLQDRVACIAVKIENRVAKISKS